MFGDAEGEGSDATWHEDSEMIAQISSSDSQLVHGGQDENRADSQAQIGDRID